MPGIPLAPTPPPPATQARNGTRVLEEWTTFRPRERLRLAVAAARAVHSRVRAGGRLEADLREFSFVLRPTSCTAEAWPPPRGERRLEPVHGLLDWMARTWESLPPTVREHEGLLFLRVLLRREGAPPSARAVCAAWLERSLLRSRHARARAWAESARKEVEFLPGGAGAGATRWPDGPPLGDMAARLEEALRDPRARPLKESPEARVCLVPWGSGTVLLKIYPAARGLDRFKDRWRAPRALRAWTAARVFAQLDLPAPLPLAVLLNTRLGGERCHLYVSEAIVGARTAREWIKPGLHHHPYEFRRKVARQLLHFYLEMERNGVIHGDTKASNLLVRLGPDGLAVSHWWIDLEAVRFDRPPFRRLQERNLIQLNGSIGRRLPREDRLAFLADFARLHPWAREPGLADHLERVTRIRLEREKRRECGH